MRTESVSLAQRCAWCAASSARRDTQWSTPGGARKQHVSLLRYKRPEHSTRCWYRTCTSHLNVRVPGKPDAGSSKEEPHGTTLEAEATYAPGGCWPGVARV